MTRPSSSTSLLARPEPTPLTSRDHDGADARRPAPAGPRQGVHPPTADDARASGNAGPVPRGWGSHAERRLVRQALGVFVLLGLYATAFVLLGHLLST